MVRTLKVCTLVPLLALALACKDGGNDLIDAAEACMDHCEHVDDCVENYDQEMCEDMCEDFDDIEDELTNACIDALEILFECVDDAVCEDVADTPHIETIDDIEAVWNTEYEGCEDESDDVEDACDPPL